MAIATDSGGTGAVTASSASFTVDITSAATGADVFVWVQWGLATATFTASGWTQIGPLSTDSTMTCVILYRRKIAGDTTFTVTPSGSAKGSHQWQSYAGLDSTTPYQAATTAANLLKKNTASTTVATPSVTNTDAAAWALAFHAHRSSTSANKVITFTPDAALVERRDGNNSGAASSIWTGGEIADSDGAVTAAAHSYTATASFSETHGIGGLLYLNPAGGGSVTVDLGLASETDTAAALALSKADALGLSTESDTAAALALAKTDTVGLATETGTAGALTTTKTVTLGMPSDTSTAHALSVSGSIGVTLGLALEADTTPQLVAAKTITLGLPVDTSTTPQLVITKTKTAGLPVETNTAPAVTLGKTRTLGLPGETDTAPAISASGAAGVTLGLAVETSVAPALAPAKTITLGLPVETGLGLQLLVTKTRTLGLAGETGLGLALVPAKAVALGLALEIDVALQIPPLVILPTPASRTLVVESDSRELVVEAETRTLVVDAETRTVTVAAESRTVTA